MWPVFLSVRGPTQVKTVWIPRKRYMTFRSNDVQRLTTFYTMLSLRLSCHTKTRLSGSCNAQMLLSVDKEDLLNYILNIELPTRSGRGSSNSLTWNSDVGGVLLSGSHTPQNVTLTVRRHLIQVLSENMTPFILILKCSLPEIIAAADQIKHVLIKLCGVPSAFKQRSRTCWGLLTVSILVIPPHYPSRGTTETGNSGSTAANVSNRAAAVCIVSQACGWTCPSSPSWPA